MQISCLFSGVNAVEGSIKCVDLGYTSDLENPNSSKYKGLATEIEYQVRGIHLIDFQHVADDFTTELC